MRRFADEYLVDLNATRAAQRAGKKGTYDATRVWAYKTLQNVQVAEYVAAKMQERAGRVEVNQDYVVRNLVEVVERCLQRAPVMVRRGSQYVQLVDDEDRNVWQFDAKGANGALSMLGKHLGIFKERVEHSGSVAVTGPEVPPQVPLEEWAGVARLQQNLLHQNRVAMTEDALARMKTNGNGATNGNGKPHANGNGHG